MFFLIADLGLKSDFHQEIIPRSMCCCLARTAYVSIEAKPMQGPGFAHLVGGEPWSSIRHPEMFCKAQLIEQTSTRDNTCRKGDFILYKPGFTRACAILSETLLAHSFVLRSLKMCLHMVCPGLFVVTKDEGS